MGWYGDPVTMVGCYSEEGLLGIPGYHVVAMDMKGYQGNSVAMIP